MIRTMLSLVCIFWIAQAGLAANSAPLKLVDLTDDYERIWDETQKLPDDRRVAQFKRSFSALLPGLYDAKRFAKFGMSVADYDHLLGQKLRDYPTDRGAILSVSRRFAKQFAPARRSFENAFGPMKGFPPIYLVNSHGEFDGGTRDLLAGSRLLFGADMIAKIHKGKSIGPFFHHELFHLLHSRTFKDCSQIWCNLWSEGLATYVALTLNPDADDEALLLTIPQPIRPAVESNRKAAGCAVLARLDSESGSDYAALFSGRPKSAIANQPPRFGYFVGLLVAQEVAKGRTLTELARLSVAETRPLVRDAVSNLCNFSNDEEF